MILALFLTWFIPPFAFAFCLALPLGGLALLLKGLKLLPTPSPPTCSPSAPGVFCCLLGWLGWGSVSERERSQVV